ncbi:MAG: hypothetical protein P4L22_00535 [Candidatus Babeliales bacterium]|nr:hypothetical protein [Candidatus Babeliales bacterium]
MSRFFYLWFLISLISSTVNANHFEKDCKAKYIVINTSKILNDFIILSDGKLLSVIKNSDYLYLQQYNNCGSIDENYSMDKVILNKNNTINAIILQKDGSALLAGKYNNNFKIAKYDNTGSLDYSFGDKTYLARSGSVITTIGCCASISSMVFNKDNKIIAAGVSENKIALARYTTDGTLDNTFGKNGIELVSLGLNNKINSLTVDEDNKIIIAATIDDKQVIIRFTHNGKLDTVFSTNC